MRERVPLFELPNTIWPCKGLVPDQKNDLPWVKNVADQFSTDGQAPRFLLTCTKAGVPVYCVAAVSLITCITFLVSSNSTVTVFYWFVDLTTTALIATYTGMLWTFI